MGVIWMTFATIALSIASAAPTIAPADPPNLKDYGLDILLHRTDGNAASAGSKRTTTGAFYSCGREALRDQAALSSPRESSVSGQPACSALQDGACYGTKGLTASRPRAESRHMQDGGCFALALEPISTERKPEDRPRNQGSTNGASRTRAVQLDGSRLVWLHPRRPNCGLSAFTAQTSCRASLGNGCVLSSPSRRDHAADTPRQRLKSMMWTHPSYAAFERLARGVDISALGDGLVRGTADYNLRRAPTSLLCIGGARLRLDDVTSADAKQRL